MERRNHGPAQGFDFSSLHAETVWRWVAVALLLVFLLLAVLFGLGGVTEVKDNEVAVIVNYVTGTTEVDTVPGNKIFIPFVQEVFTMDKSPNRFLMEGKEDVSTDHVRELTVRASDGSNFWFGSLEIQYQLIPGDAATVIQDSGVGDAFKKFWLMAYARSILRDEFGKFDPEGISDPSKYAAAKADAQVRLNKALKPHGIEITQVITPKPRFAEDYEKAIEDRKLADQERERLKAQAIQLQQEKARRLAEIDTEKGQAFAALKGEMEAKKAMAEASKIKLEREADAFKIQRVGEGEAQRLASLQQAQGLLVKYQKEAQGLQAKVEALAGGGLSVVIEALAKKLPDIPIQVVPYQRSPAPARIELPGEQPGPAARQPTETSSKTQRTGGPAGEGR